MIRMSLLGLLQGFTEFLPVDSSGHLVLFEIISGMPRKGIQIEMALHAATLLSVILYFWKDWFVLFREKRQWLVWIGVSTFITGSIALIFKPFLLHLYEIPLVVCSGFLVTAALLFAANKIQLPEKELSLKIAVIFGLAQAAALIPGISRSGSTMAVLIFCGLRREEVFRYSFLAAAPILFLACVSEINMDIFQVYPASEIAAGMFFSFVAGFASLAVIRGTTISRKFHYFAYYLAAAGIAGLVYFSFITKGN